jgi:DNA mismatch endonuclease (patch repair protein)
MPATRPEFWREKLERNKTRDLQAITALTELGWRVLVVWECFVRQQPNLQELGSAMSTWIEGTRVLGEFPQPSD